MKRQWECPHAELMWVKVDPWVIFPKNGHGHPPINRGQESPMMVTLPYPTIPNYNYIPCCDHGTCGDGEPITSFIQFSWSPPFQGSWTTIRRNLNWHKIEDWNRKIVAIISNHAWGIIQSLTSECNKFGLGLAIDRCIDFLGAETYVLSIRPKVVSQRQNLAFDVCPGSRLKSNWTLDRFFKIHVIFIWLVVLIVLFYHPSKNGMMLPNASINFGSETQPQLDSCRRKSLNHQPVPAIFHSNFPRASPDEVNGHGDSPLHLACRLGPFARSYFVKRTIQSPKSDQPAPSLTPVVLITPLLTQSFWHEAMLHIRQTPFQGSDTQSEVGSEGRVGMAM